MAPETRKLTFPDGNTLENLLRCAKNSREKGDFAEAISYYVAARKKQGADVVTILRDAGLTYLEWDNSKYYGEAEKCFDEALEINPGCSGVLVLKGQACLSKRYSEPERALGYFEEATQINPTDKEALECKGDLFYELKRNSEAAACYYTLLGLDSSYENRKKWYSKAMRSCERITDKDKDWADLRIEGNLKRYNSDFEEAIGIYNLALKWLEGSSGELADINANANAATVLEDMIVTYRRIGDDVGRGDCYKALADVRPNQREENLEEAKTLYGGVVQYTEDNKKAHMSNLFYKRALIGLMATHIDLREHAEAARCCMRCAKLETELEKEKAWYEMVLNHLETETGVAATAIKEMAQRALESANAPTGYEQKIRQVADDKPEGAGSACDFLGNLGKGGWDKKIGARLPSEDDVLGGLEQLVQTDMRQPLDNCMTAAERADMFNEIPDLLNGVLRCCDGVLKQDSKNVFALNKKSRILFYLGYYADAQKGYARIADEMDTNAGALVFKGLTFFARGKYELAIKTFKAATAADSNCGAAWFNEGIAYLSLKKYELAIGCFNRAVDLDPNDVDAYSQKAKAHHELRDFVKELECRRRIEKLREENIEVAW